MPFDRAVFGQWRCYWPFGGGMFTDLFVHQTTHMIAAMGVRYPARVVGGGGIYLEYDDRDVPDVATIVADYDEGCQLIITATMINDTQLDEVIRGHLATIKFVGGGDYMKGFEVYGQNIAGGPAKPKQGFGKPVHTFDESQEGQRHLRPVGELPGVRPRRNRETLSTPELGAAAFTHGQHGRAELSPRQGAVLGQGAAQDHGCRYGLGARTGRSAARSAASPTRSSAGRPATRAAR